MAKSWGFFGVADRVPVKIPLETEDQLRKELKSRGIDLASFPSFVESLGSAITSYRSLQDICRRGKLGKLRKNLKMAVAAATKLSDRLQSLDESPLFLLRYDIPTDLEASQNAIRRIVRFLNAATSLASEYPERGRTIDWAGPLLAHDVAVAIRTHLGKKPTMTRTGVYIAVLSIVLEVATGKPASEVHALAANGLRIKPFEASDLHRFMPSESSK